MIAVIAAMRAEARTARALAGENCRIVISGIGPRHAHNAAQRCLDAGAEGLLVWGTAGALRDNLATGTLVLPREVHGADGKRLTIAPDWHARLMQRVPNGMAVNDGAIVTVSRPVSGREARTALHDRSGAVAVDMETAAIAALASQHAIPFAAVRAIADPLELELPPVLLKARSERLLPLEVMLRLCGRPRDFPALMRLSQAMRDATASLAAFAERLAAADHGAAT